MRDREREGQTEGGREREDITAPKLPYLTK